MKFATYNLLISLLIGSSLQAVGSQYDSLETYTQNREIQYDALGYSFTVNQTPYVQQQDAANLLLENCYQYLNTCNKEDSVFRQNVIKKLGAVIVELSTFEDQFTTLCKKIGIEEPDLRGQSDFLQADIQDPTFVDNKSTTELLSYLLAYRMLLKIINSISIEFLAKYQAKKDVLSIAQNPKATSAFSSDNILTALVADELAIFEQNIKKILPEMTPDVQVLCQYLGLKIKNVITAQVANEESPISELLQLICLNSTGYQIFIDAFLHNPAYAEIWQAIVVTGDTEAPDEHFFAISSTAFQGMCLLELKTIYASLQNLSQTTPNPANATVLNEICGLLDLAAREAIHNTEFRPLTTVGLSLCAAVYIKHIGDELLNTVSDCLVPN